MAERNRARPYVSSHSSGPFSRLYGPVRVVFLFILLTAPVFGAIDDAVIRPTGADERVSLEFALRRIRLQIESGERDITAALSPGVHEWTATHSKLFIPSGVNVTLFGSIGQNGLLPSASEERVVVVGSTVAINSPPAATNGTFVVESGATLTLVGLTFEDMRGTIVRVSEGGMLGVMTCAFRWTQDYASLPSTNHSSSGADAESALHVLGSAHLNYTMFDNIGHVDAATALVNGVNRDIAYDFTEWDNTSESRAHVRVGSRGALLGTVCTFSGGSEVVAAFGNSRVSLDGCEFKGCTHRCVVASENATVAIEGGTAVLSESGGAFVSAVGETRVYLTGVHVSNGIYERLRYVNESVQGQEGWLSECAAIVVSGHAMVDAIDLSVTLGSCRVFVLSGMAAVTLKGFVAAVEAASHVMMVSHASSVSVMDSSIECGNVMMAVSLSGTTAFSIARSSMNGTRLFTMSETATLAMDGVEVRIGSTEVSSEDEHAFVLVGEASASVQGCRISSKVKRHVGYHSSHSFFLEESSRLNISYTKVFDVAGVVAASGKSAVIMLSVDVMGSRLMPWENLEFSDQLDDAIEGSDIVRGGVVVLEGSAVLYVAECLFQWLSTVDEGGVVYAVGQSRATMVDSIVRGAGGRCAKGGAFYIDEHSEINVSNSKFEGIRAMFEFVLQNLITKDCWGGFAIVRGDSVLRVDNVEIRKPQAKIGAIFYESGNGQVIARNVSFESAVASDRAGVAFVSEGASLDVVGLRGVDAWADAEGAIFMASDAASVTAVDVHVTTVAAYRGGLVSVMGSAVVSIHDAVVRGIKVRNHFLLAVIFGEREDSTESAEIALAGVTPIGGVIYAGERATLRVTGLVTSQVESDWLGAIVGVADSTVVVLSDVHAYDIVAEGNGGAVYAMGSSSLTMDGVRVNRVAVNGHGGFLYASGRARITMRNAEVGHSTSVRNGGVLYITDSAVVNLWNAVVTNASSLGIGGVLYLVRNGTVSMRDSRISESRAKGSGGVLFSLGTSRTMLANTTVVSGTSLEGDGGCLYLAEAASLLISNSTVQSCKCELRGSFLCVTGTSSAWLFTCSLSDGWAGERGGGIFATDATSVLMRTGTVSDTTSMEGGGFLAAEGESRAQFENCSFRGVRSIGGNGGFVLAYEHSNVTFADGRVEDARCDVGLGGGLYLSDFATAVVSGYSLVGLRSLQNGGIMAQTGASIARLLSCVVENVWSDGAVPGILLRGASVLHTRGLHATNVMRPVGFGEVWLYASEGAAELSDDVRCDNCTARLYNSEKTFYFFLWFSIFPNSELWETSFDVPVRFEDYAERAIADGAATMFMYVGADAIGYTLDTDTSFAIGQVRFTTSFIRVRTTVMMSICLFSDMAGMSIEATGKVVLVDGAFVRTTVEVRGYLNLLTASFDESSSLVVSGDGFVICNECKFYGTSSRRAIDIGAARTGPPVILLGSAIASFMDLVVKSISTVGNGGFARISDYAILQVHTATVGRISASGNGGFVSAEAASGGSYSSQRIAMTNMTIQEAVAGSGGGLIFAAGYTACVMFNVNVITSSAVDSGGLILLDEYASIRMVGVRIGNSGVSGDGGGGGGVIHGRGSPSVSLTNVVVTEGHSSSVGGVISVNPFAVGVDESLPTVSLNGVTVASSYARSGGGLIYTRGAVIDIDGCHFNKAESDGPGGFLQCTGDRSSSIHIRTSMFAASASGTSGGLVNLNDESFVSFADCVGGQFSARIAGGAAIVKGGRLELWRCVIIDMGVARGAGGAFSVEAGVLALVDSTFQRSFAGVGGGFAVIQAVGSALWTNVTIEDADSFYLGGGVCAMSGLGSLVGIGVTVRRSTCFGPGGAFLVDGYASLVLKYSTLLHATSSFGDGGGASIAGKSTAVLSDVLFQDVSSPGVGGAVSSRGESRLTLVRVHIERARSSEGDGGALAAGDKAVVGATNVSVVNASAPTGRGGGLSLSGSAVLFAEGLHLSTVAAYEGGAVAVSKNVAVALVDSVFENADADSNGGCLLALSGSLSIHNGNFTNCRAAKVESTYGTGGFLYVADSAGPGLFVQHATVQGSEAAAGPVVFSTSNLHNTDAYFASATHYNAQYGNGTFASPPARFSVLGADGKAIDAPVSLVTGGYLPTFAVTLADAYRNDAFASPFLPLAIRLSVAEGSNCTISGDLTRTFVLSARVEYIDTSVRVSSPSVPATCVIVFRSGNLLYSDMDALFGTAKLGVGIAPCGDGTALTVEKESGLFVCGDITSSAPLNASGSSTSTIVGVTVGVSAVCLVALVGAYLLVRRARRQWNQKQIDDFARHVQECSPDIAQLELPMDCIELQDELGHGEFGIVYRAQVMFGSTIRMCAAKSLKSGLSVEQRIQFMSEAQIMLNLKHKNVVSLVGVHTTTDPMLIILEYAPHGSLKGFLGKLARHRHRNKALTIDALLAGFARDIAEGMKYLATQNIVHKDLAARNVMVGNDALGEYVLKVADFGLSRETDNGYYRKSKAAPIPIKWTAIESLQRSVWSWKSDCWSFGVVLWELWTFGEPAGRPTFAELAAYFDGFHESKRMESQKSAALTNGGTLLNILSPGAQLRDRAGIRTQLTVSTTDDMQENLAKQRNTTDVDGKLLQKLYDNKMENTPSNPYVGFNDVPWDQVDSSEGEGRQLSRGLRNHESAYANDPECSAFSNENVESHNSDYVHLSSGSVHNALQTIAVEIRDSDV